MMQSLAWATAEGCTSVSGVGMPEVMVIEC
jgi:hypothetical protein